jgi:hypothetical protein
VQIIALLTSAVKSEGLVRGAGRGAQKGIHYLMPTHLCGKCHSPMQYICTKCSLGVDCCCGCSQATRILHVDSKEAAGLMRARRLSDQLDDTRSKLRQA